MCRPAEHVACLASADDSSPSQFAEALASAVAAAAAGGGGDGLVY